MWRDGDKQLPRARRLGGFTLVELLITVSIFVLLTGVTLYTTTVSTRERQLELATEGLRSGLEQARSLALAPPVAKTIGNAGYRFVFVPRPDRPNTYAGFEIRELGSLPGQVAVRPAAEPVETGLFPGRIGFQTIDGAPPPSIVFSIPGQGRIIEPVTADGRIRLKAVVLSNPSVSREVTISTITGQISVANP